MSVILKKKFLQSSPNLSSSKNDCIRKHDNYDFSSLQNDEEIKEITLQLVMIRKAYDHIQLENLKKREKIELMGKQIGKLDSTTATCNEDQTSISARMSFINEELDSLKQKLEKESLDNKTLSQMHNRMKAEAVQLELKSSNLHSTLNLVKSHLNQYEKKSLGNKEQKAQSQRVLKTIAEELVVEKKNKEDLIKRLEKAATNKKEATERRINRINKQAEIAEKTANENRNAQEIECKEQINLFKIYYSYLKYKQEKAFKDSENAEDAFTKIRVATGISSVQTVVDQFLKKDELIGSLQDTISESENQLGLLKVKNEKVKSVLNELLLVSKGISSDSVMHIAELHKQIEVQKRFLIKNEEENNVAKGHYSEIKDIIIKINSNLRIKKLNENPEVNDCLDVLKECRRLCDEINWDRDHRLGELERVNKMKVLELLREIHPNSRTKPNYIHETSFTQEDNVLR